MEQYTISLYAVCTSFESALLMIQTPNPTSIVPTSVALRCLCLFSWLFLIVFYDLRSRLSLSLSMHTLSLSLLLPYLSSLWLFSPPLFCSYCSALKQPNRRHLWTILTSGMYHPSILMSTSPFSALFVPPPKSAQYHPLTLTFLLWSHSSLQIESSRYRGCRETVYCLPRPVRQLTDTGGDWWQYYPLLINIIRSYSAATLYSPWE
jgi:hypothetical protein